VAYDVDAAFVLLESLPFGLFGVMEHRVAREALQ
jgi:hypothetical protein